MISSAPLSIWLQSAVAWMQSYCFFKTGQTSMPKIIASGHLYTMQPTTAIPRSAILCSSGKRITMYSERCELHRTNWLSTCARAPAVSMPSITSGGHAKTGTSIWSECSLERARMSMNKLRLSRILHCTSQPSMDTS